MNALSCSSAGSVAMLVGYWAASGPNPGCLPCPAARAALGCSALTSGESDKPAAETPSIEPKWRREMRVMGTVLFCREPAHDASDWWQPSDTIATSAPQRRVAARAADVRWADASRMDRDAVVLGSVRGNVVLDDQAGRGD
jgi:hypothetical protein